VIKIYTRYPVVQKEDENEISQNEPIVNITQELLGFVLIDLKPYLVNPEISNIEQKYSVFEYNEEQIFKNSEIFWPLPDDNILQELCKDKIQDLRQKKYFPKKEPEQIDQAVSKGKIPAGKNVKKPVVAKKKPAQKPVKGKKGASEEEVVKVEILDWKNDSRTALAYKNDFLGR
jgi:hypothetical protein